MTVIYETNRWGDRVATFNDGPGAAVSPKPVEQNPKWMQDILDNMNAFDASAKPVD